MGRHAIIVIKNNKNEFLQYYDNRWDSYLFLNCKLGEEHNEEYVKNEVSEKLDILEDRIECKYLNDIIHTKYSESAKKDKEYHHFFYEINIKEIPECMRKKEFILNDIKYSWYSIKELEKDDRIQKVNSDIVGFVKEMTL